MTGNKEDLEAIAPTSFGQEGVLERSDLQRLLRDKPEILEEGLLIISEEFRDWEDSNRSIDLLGLDAKGRLVVIELKRGETGQHMDLQAIRYAAMVANMTFPQAVKALQAYLEKRANETDKSIEPDDMGTGQDEAETILREHLNTREEDPSIDTEVPRIILASENFSKELTTCVLWLNASSLTSKGIDIKCVRLQPHRNGEEILLEVATLIPLPEASAYQIRIAERQREERTQRSGKAQRFPGGEAFEDYIDKADEHHQPFLRRLFKKAEILRDTGLADLHVFVNGAGNYVQLYPRLLNSDESLVSFNILFWRGGLGEISVWQGWQELAPNALSRIDELIGATTSLSGVRHRRLSKGKTLDNLDATLDAIVDAYREANGAKVDDNNGVAE